MNNIDIGFINWFLYGIIAVIYFIIYAKIKKFKDLSIPDSTTIYYLVLCIILGPISLMTVVIMTILQFFDDRVNKEKRNEIIKNK